MTDARALAGIRVVDLATSRAELAGRVLADLGADVIKVEPPGGADARRLPPFRNGAEVNDGIAAYGFTPDDIRSIEREMALKLIPRLKQA